MPATKSGEKSRTKSSSHSSEIDAIVLLMEDHKKVKKLFKEYEKLSRKEDFSGKAEIAETICEELIVHTSIEEEIFYPMVRDAINDDDMMNEAEIEHATAKNLISAIRDMYGDDPMYDANVKVLCEYINHHVEEEESKMFPKVRKSKLDLEGLGVQMLEYKEEMTSAMLV